MFVTGFKICKLCIHYLMHYNHNKERQNRSKKHDFERHTQKHKNLVLLKIYKTNIAILKNIKYFIEMFTNGLLL